MFSWLTLRKVSKNNVKNQKAQITTVKIGPDLKLKLTEKVKYMPNQGFNLEGHFTAVTILEISNNNLVELEGHIFVNMPLLTKLNA